MPIFMRLHDTIIGFARRAGDAGWRDELYGGGTGVSRACPERSRRVQPGGDASPPAPLVRARLLRGQIAGLFDSLQIQPAGRKLRDMPATPGSEFYLENLG